MKALRTQKCLESAKGPLGEKEIHLSIAGMHRKGLIYKLRLCLPSLAPVSSSCVPRTASRLLHPASRVLHPAYLDF